jgi:hypothetical protein
MIFLFSYNEIEKSFALVEKYVLQEINKEK